MYTLINVYEIYGGAYGIYLAFNIIFISIGVFVLAGVLISHLT